MEGGGWGGAVIRTCFNFCLSFWPFKSIWFGNKLNFFSPSWLCLPVGDKIDLPLSTPTPELFSSYCSPRVLLRKGSEQVAGWAAGSWPRSPQETVTDSWGSMTAYLSGYPLSHVNRAWTPVKVSCESFLISQRCYIGKNGGKRKKSLV